MQGSSPLARGLHSDKLEKNKLPRIIPARAGFTISTSIRRTGPQDHPRSRGVYTAATPTVPVSLGSSPLARGLPRSIRSNRTRPRIIPARAGFTDFSPMITHLKEDHPRSRGVYGGGFTSSANSSGSSPLARGLPGMDSWSVSSSRIIPARAGFTSDDEPRKPDLTDHPRSRGVYAATPRMAARIVGSSPLARGLLS